MRIRPIKRRQLRKLFLDPGPNQVLVAQSLVAHSLGKQLIEVKLVLHEEINAGGIELHHFFVHDLGIGENVKVKWTHNIFVLLFIPLKSGDSELECVHPLAVMLDFLVLVLDCVIVVLLVLKINREP